MAVRPPHARRALRRRPHVRHPDPSERAHPAHESLHRRLADAAPHSRRRRRAHDARGQRALNSACTPPPSSSRTTPTRSTISTAPSWWPGARLLSTTRKPCSSCSSRALDESRRAAMRVPMLGDRAVRPRLRVVHRPRREGGWLSLGAKGWAPTVTSTSGIGTAHAVAEAKATRQDIADWCANWSPDDAGCVAREMASEEAKRTYRATADCTRGHHHAGRRRDLHARRRLGRERHRRRPHALARCRRPDRRSRQRERRARHLAAVGSAVPRPVEGCQPAKAGPPSAPKAPAAAAAAGDFAVGDVIEAKYGREWIRGRIDKIRPGPEYDVRLDNGQRGILPPRMIRKADQ